MATLFDRFANQYSDTITGTQTISERDAIDSIINIVKETPGQTFATFANSNNKYLADIIEGLNVDNNYILFKSEQIKIASSNLLDSCLSNTEFESSLANILKSASIIQLINEWIQDAFITKITDLSQKDMGEIAVQINQLNCSHPYIKELSNEILSNALGFLNSNTLVFLFKSNISFDGENVPLMTGYNIKVEREIESQFVEQGTLITDGEAKFQFPFQKVVDDDDIDLSDESFRFTVYKKEEDEEILGTARTRTISNFENPIIEDEGFIFEFEAPALPFSPSISELRTKSIVQISGTLLNELAPSGSTIDNLRDVRSLGGIQTLYKTMDSPPSVTETDLSDFEKIDVYAAIDFTTEEIYLNEDSRIDLNTALISLGYKNPYEISKVNVEKFSYDITNIEGIEISEDIAKLIYNKASTAADTASNLVMGVRSKGSQDSENLGESEKVLEAHLSENCDCSDCETALSPLAYLASLIDFTTRNVKTSSTSTLPPQFLTLQNLVEIFYQPFDELPAECDEVDKLVCQQRLAVEVLRSYINSNFSSTTVDVKTYLIKAYTTFLEKNGTSYEEIRLLNSGSNENTIKSIANRIEVESDYEALDFLKINDSNLSEAKLEEIFGIQDSTRNRLSDGVKIGDAGNLITKWNLHGLKWNKNTDENGFIYLTITNTTTSIYKDEAKTNLIAEGSLTNNKVVLNAKNYSGLTAEFTFANTPGTINDIKIKAINQLLSEKLKYLYSNWQNQEVQFSNPYISHEYPIIDPDLIGIENLRNYTDLSSSSTTNIAAKIWIKRWEAINTWYNLLLKSSPTVYRPHVGTDSMFTLMTTTTVPITYNYEGGYVITLNPSTKPIWQLDGFNLDSTYNNIINNNITPEIINNLNSRMYLSIESFKRYYELYSKSSLTESLDLDEKFEYINILISSIKARANDTGILVNKTWVKEEISNSIILSNNLFIEDNDEPKILTVSNSNGKILLVNSTSADTPATVNKTIIIPFIDPELITVSQLIDAKYSPDTIVKWHNRKDEISTKHNTLQGIAKNNDFMTLLDNIYDLSDFSTNYRTSSGMTLTVIVNAIDSDLNSIDQALISKAESEIKNILLSVSDFKLLMNFKTKKNSSNAVISDSEYKSIAAILTTVWKIKDRYCFISGGPFEDYWYDEEKEDLARWQMLKQQLPVWRADIQKRQLWNDAFELNKSNPSVDPDIISDLDLFLPKYGHEIYSIYLDRSIELNALRNNNYNTAISSTTNTNQSTKCSFITNKINEFTNIGLEEFLSLKEKLENGESIGGRLKQVDINFSDFEFWCTLYSLGTVNADIQNSEWKIFIYSLVNIYKIRQFAKWRNEEIANGIFVNPLLFDNSNTTNLINEDAPEEWQQRFENLFRRWKQTLDERYSQQETLISSYNELIHQVEEECLKDLRDLLLNAIPIPSGENQMHLDTLSYNAKKYDGLLLIDMQNNCCQRTTRVAQAIDTLQNLLWKLRIGVLVNQYPNFSIDSVIFDNQWQWLGSYETWRSYIFVFIYPENLLLPTIRTWPSIAFKEFVEKLRTRTILNKTDAALAASQFYDYVKDVASINVQASCRGTTTLFERDEYGREYTTKKELIYSFGKSQNNKFYYCTIDPLDKYGFGQSDWRELPFSDKALGKIYGARFYDYWDTPSIHVFFSTYTEKGNKLSSIKIRLDKNNSLHETYGWEINADGLLSNKDGDDWNIDYNNIVISEGEFIENTNTPQNRYIAVSYLKTVGISKLLFFRFLKPVTLDEWDDEFKVFAQDVTQSVHSFSNLYYLREYKETGLAGSIMFKSYLLVADNTIPNPTTLNTVNGKMVFASIHIHNDWWLHSNPQYYVSPTQTEILKDLHTATVWTFASNSILDPYKLQGVYSYQNSNSNNVIINAIETHIIQGIPIEYPIRLRLEFNSNNEFNQITSTIGNYDFDKIISVIKVANTHYIQYQNDVSYSNNVAQFGIIIVNNGLVISQYNIVPNIKNLTYILGKKTTSELNALKLEQTNVFALNPLDTINNKVVGNGRIYNLLEEAYYFVPMYVAERLQKSGDYINALDWYQTVYNYTQPKPSRKINWGLIKEENSFIRISNWSADPSNPHNIAALRHNSYTSYTLQNIIRCLLGYADSEFAADTPESVSRAKSLYITALGLLEDPLMNPRDSACKTTAGLLQLYYPDEPKYQMQDRELQQLLSCITNNDNLGVVISEINSIFVNSSLTVDQKFENSRLVLWTEIQKNDGIIVVSDRIEQAEKSGQISTMAMHTVNSVNSYASNNNNTEIVIPAYVPSLNYNYCVPPNPIADGLRLRANLNLFKIRNCRNIAGMIRELDPYAAPTDATTGIPKIGENGTISRPRRKPLKSSDYTFKVVIARAKELAEMANRMENTLLSYYEKTDSENYNLLKAKQDLSVAKASVKLQDLRYKEAEDGVQLASLEKELANIQATAYGNWLSSGLNEFESAMLGLYSEIANLQNQLAYVNATTQAAQSLLSADYTKNPASVVLASISAASAFVGAGYQNEINNRSSHLQYVSFMASQKRRMDEWKLQLDLANKNIQIGDQKIKIANDQVRVAGQEKKISEMQSNNAEQSLEFLRNKFTNAELYEWMSGLIAKTYMFFLDHATAVARLASDQLYFERQSFDSPTLLANYYDAPIDSSTTGNSSVPDRRGLTGSYRLLQDIAALEQYAFDTDKRKLQLSKTISLAKQKSIEFQKLKNDGEITFATMQSDFDKDFPGQYLRLIKRVRVSVIALVPSIEGIKASLTCIGNSNVVIKNEDNFEVNRISRPSESISLTSSNNATGLFEMEMQHSEFLFPFEGIGVETIWNFTLAKASNKFDFSTIADVLITIDYTALEDVNYRSIVAKKLDEQTNVSEGELSFSLRNNYPDQWYDLYNSANTDGLLKVSFDTAKQDFPSNINDIGMSEFKLYFVTEKNDPNNGGQTEDFDKTNITLEFNEIGKKSSNGVGGESQCIEGLCKWPLAKKTLPYGTWNLSIPSTEKTRNLFKDNLVNDIIIVISLRGNNIQWPSSYKLGK